MFSSHVIFFLFFRFEIEFHKYEYFTNDEKTRSFIGLCLEPRARDQVIGIIKQVDKTMAAFQKQLYYQVTSVDVFALWFTGI